MQGQKTGGRSKGTPNKIGADVREAAQAFTAKAIATLAEIMQDKKQPGAARVSAASAILDRGHGKARQPVDHELDLSKLTDDQLAVLATALGSPAALGKGAGGDGKTKG